MVYRRESVNARLRKLGEVLEKLRGKEAVSLEEYRNNADLQWTIERGLEVALSLILDIGNHILVGVFQISVDEYEQILSELKQQHVITRGRCMHFQSLFLRLQSGLKSMVKAKTLGKALDMIGKM